MNYRGLVILLAVIFIFIFYHESNAVKIRRIHRPRYSGTELSLPMYYDSNINSSLLLRAKFSNYETPVLLDTGFGGYNVYNTFAARAENYYINKMGLAYWHSLSIEDMYEKIIYFNDEYRSSYSSDFYENCTVLDDEYQVELVSISDIVPVNTKLLMCPMLEVRNSLGNLPPNKIPAKEIFMQNNFNNLPHILTIEYLLEQVPILMDFENYVLKLNANIDDLRTKRVYVMDHIMTDGVYALRMTLNGVSGYFIMDTGFSGTITVYDNHRDIFNFDNTNENRLIQQMGISGTQTCSDLTYGDLEIVPGNIINQVPVMLSSSDNKGSDEIYGYVGIVILKYFNILISSNFDVLFFKNENFNNIDCGYIQDFYNTISTSGRCT